MPAPGPAWAGRRFSSPPSPARVRAPSPTARRPEPGASVPLLLAAFVVAAARGRGHRVFVIAARALRRAAFDGDAVLDVLHALAVLDHVLDAVLGLALGHRTFQRDHAAAALHRDFAGVDVV